MNVAIAGASQSTNCDAELEGAAHLADDSTSSISSTLFEELQVRYGGFAHADGASPRIR